LSVIFHTCAFDWTLCFILTGFMELIVRMQTRFESNNKTSLNEKILVTYYSRSGNTRYVAEEISKRLGADVDVIKNKPKGRGVDYTRDPSDYNLVIVGTPVNGFTVSRPVMKYLEKNRGRFNEIATYATYSLWPAGTLNRMGRLSGKTPIASTTFKSRDIKLNQISEKIDAFIDRIDENYPLYEPSPVIQLTG
jgi:flavodoxin